MPYPPMKGLDGGCAGKDDEIECSDLAECNIEGREGHGRRDFDGGDEDRNRPQPQQLIGERGRLVRSACDENPTIFKRKHFSKSSVLSLNFLQKLLRDQEGLSF